MRESAELRPGDGCALRGGIEQPISAEDLVERVVSFDALYQSMGRCKANTMWKESVSAFVLNGVQRCSRMADQLADGTFKHGKPRMFEITHPKRRECVSVPFRDRVYQRSLNDNAIYPIMSRSFVVENCACQHGKGTDFARDRLAENMRRHYRKHGKDGYVLQFDVKGYYPNMRHDLAEQMFRNRLPSEIAEMAIDVLRSQYPGDVGYNPGSQLVQIAGISFLDPLDHYIKERLRCKLYIRYMDDFILISHDKAYLERCRREITEQLAKVGMASNGRKTKLYPLSDGITFLGFRFRITDSGKVVRRVKASKLRESRRRMRKMVGLARKGVIGREKCDQCFKVTKSYLSKATSRRHVTELDMFYANLWKEKQWQ